MAHAFLRAVSPFLATYFLDCPPWPNPERDSFVRLNRQAARRDPPLLFEMPVEERGSHLKQRLRRVVHRIAEAVTGARDLIES